MMRGRMPGSRTAAAALVLACLMAAPPAACAAEALGRLFLTPDQRAKLESRRQLKTVETTTTQTDTTEEEAPAASYLTVQGEITRSGGKHTVFVNGQAYATPDSPRGVQLTRGRRTGEVVVVPNETAAPVDLKVGQSLDKNSLTVDDALARAGSITIGKQPVAKRKGEAAK